ncbi:MAG TPA: hypothetical protein VIM84_08125, partial [Gemmatimonadales bacterium]
GPVELDFADVRPVAVDEHWPGMPILMVADAQRAIIGSRAASEVQGHWSSAPAFVAAARLAIERLTGRS